MSKLELNDISSGYATPTIVNANSAATEAAFEKTLSRDGTSPNQMEANLDMNGYSILNQANPVTLTGGFNWEGTWVTATAYQVSDAVYTGGSSYVCLVAHTSGTFATDLTAAKWQLLASGTFPAQTSAAGKLLTSNGTTTSWIADNFINVRNYPYSAVANGSTDDSSAIQGAINAANTAGYGMVVLDGVFAIATKITLKSNCGVLFTPGSYLKWTGSTSGTCVDTPDSGVLTNANWYNLTLDTGASFTGTAFRLHSMNRVYADVLTAITTGSASKAFVFTADSSAGGDANTKRNIVNCTFGAIRQKGICGTFIQFSGTLVGYGGDPDVITLNTFGQTFAEECNVRGYSFVDYTDNNRFPGQNRVLLNANNAVGLDHPGTGGAGVYANHFGQLGVDTFGSLTGRIGVRLRSTKGFKVDFYYQSPEAEGGILDINNTVKSYDINYFIDNATNDGFGIRYNRNMLESGAGYNSNIPITLADDAATSIDLKGYGTEENIYVNVSIASQNLNCNGIVHCHLRRSAGTAYSLLLTTSTNLVANTGAMLGTTGTDTKLTVSAHTDGKIYFENRTGASITFVPTFLNRFVTG